MIDAVDSAHPTGVTNQALYVKKIEIAAVKANVALLVFSLK
jgi:hypothetical protein